MKFNSLFGREFDCDCGRNHQIETKEILYSESVYQKLPLLAWKLIGKANVAVLMDQRTRLAAGHLAVSELNQAGFKVKEILIPDPATGKTPICDDVTKENVEKQIVETDWILGVGSGVINDLGKWLAYDTRAPYISLATAASMNGYATVNIAPTLKGMKSLAFAKPPVAVVSSPSLLLKAPYKMTTAGLGDVLAKSISTADWRLNHILFGDYFCEKSAAIVAEIEPLYLDNPERIAAKNKRSFKALFHSLLLTGLAVNMARDTIAASGGEHLISHCLDMMSAIDGEPHDLHGRQVGIGTILMAELYKRVLSVENPDLSTDLFSSDFSKWGPLEGFVKANYKKKLNRIDLAKHKISSGATWDNIRQELASIPRSPQLISDCLIKAKAATRAEDINCTRNRLLEAFLRARAIRSRFTVIDIAYMLGILPGKVAEIIESWV
jgi:glycerol-1-phosphate dehydrogenase [NAD(P)+]